MKVTEKILECLEDSQEEIVDCHERNEIKTYLGSNEHSFIPFRLVKNAYNCVKKKGVYLFKIDTYHMHGQSHVLLNHRNY